MRTSLLFLVSLAMGAAQTSVPPTEQRALDIIDTGSTEKNPESRREATIAASLMGARPQAYKILTDKLDDGDVLVRVAAIASLTDLNDPRSIPLVKKMLQDKVPEVSFAAAKALWSLKDPSGKEVLLSVLEGESKTKSNLLSSQTRDTMRMLKTPKAALFFAFRTGAGFVPIPGLGAGVAGLQALLADSEFSGRAASAILLAKETDPEVMAALKAGLSDRDWSVRAACVQVLAMRNQPAARQDLEPLLDDKKDQVRFRAAAAYVRLSIMARETPPAPPKPLPAAKKPAPRKKT